MRGRLLPRVAIARLASLRRRAVRFRLPRLLRRAPWTVYQAARRSAIETTAAYRGLMRKTIFVGVTGSSGKSTAVQLIAAALSSRGRVTCSAGNRPEFVVKNLLRTRPGPGFCVQEVAATGPGTLDETLHMVRPQVAVVTNIRADHRAAFRTLEATAAEKSKLVACLPPEGIAVLNADDPLVLGMAPLCKGRVVTYGMGPEAMVRGENPRGTWPDRFALTVRYEGRAAEVGTQLCGTHWATPVLAAIASGIALGLTLEQAAAPLAGVPPWPGRMSPVELPDGITFIRDDWKAGLYTIEPALEFLRHARARRRVFVLGTISDYPGDSGRRYTAVARQALEACDHVFSAGRWATRTLRARRHPGDDSVRAFATVKELSDFLQGFLRSGDLVLLKGSNPADHLVRVLLARTGRVECWRAQCGRKAFCDECRLLLVPSRPRVPSVTSLGRPVRAPEGTGVDAVVVGFGNPGPHLVETRHNVGRQVVDDLGRMLGAQWERHAGARVARVEHDGLCLLLVEPLEGVNHSGSVLRALADEVGFDVEDCVLVYDDVDLPVGGVKTRIRGGPGGHNGVASVMQAFQSEEFRRVKIGIGCPPRGIPLPEHVLSPFTSEERSAIEAARARALERVFELLPRRAHPVPSAMARAPREESR